MSRSKRGPAAIVIVLVVALAAVYAVRRERARACESRGGEPAGLGGCAAPVLGALWPGRAGWSERLRFEPAKPAEGDVVIVTYEPDVGHFADDSRLALRAVLGDEVVTVHRTAEQAHRVAVLERVGDRYQGELRLPAGVTYGRFAVESEDGERIDANAGWMWELVAHDGNGRPRYDALIRRFNAAMFGGRDVDLIGETGRVMLALDRRRPWGSYAMMGARTVLRREDAGWVIADAYYRGARDRANRLATLPLEDAALLAEWARQLNRDQDAAHWKRRLITEHPTSTAAIDSRAEVLRERLGNDLPRLLDSLEALWSVPRRGSNALVLFGLWTAATIGDADASNRWLNRATDVQPWMLARFERQAAGLKGMSSHTIARVRAQLAAIEQVDAPGRGLDEPVSDYQRRQIPIVAELRGQLGAALVQEGAVVEGVAELWRAVAYHASTHAHQAYAMVLLSQGDTASAQRELAARADIEDYRAATVEDSARLVLKQSFDQATWSREVEFARKRRFTMLRNSGVCDSIDDVRLLDGNGRPVTLRQLVKRRPLVVTVLPSFPIAGRLFVPNQYADGLRPLADWVVITSDSAVAFDAAVREARGIRLPVYYDASGRALVEPGRRRYEEAIVLDREARVRFRAVATSSTKPYVDALVDEQSATESSPDHRAG